MRPAPLVLAAVALALGHPAAAAAQRAHDSRFGVWLEAGPGFGTPGVSGVVGVGLRLHPVTLGFAYAKAQGSGELRETRYTELNALLIGVQRWRSRGSVSIEAGPALVDRWEEDECDGDCDERRLDLGDALGPAIRLTGTMTPTSWFAFGLSGVASFSDEFDAVIYVYVRLGAFP